MILTIDHISAMRDEFAKIAEAVSEDRFAKQAFAAPPSTKPISTAPVSGDRISPLKPGKVPSKDANAPRAKRVNVVGFKGLGQGPLNKPPVTNA